MVRLAFIWHHHQPYYRDPTTGRAALPWVRLHATKDYWGMARLISEFPKIRATVNLVPSLVEQLLLFADEGASDEWLEFIAPDPGALHERDRERLVAHGFHANEHTMIAPFPRYKELLRKRVVGSRFSRQDLLDLQVLANLAWFHRILLEEDPLLAELRKKGRDYSESDKKSLLAKQREIARTVMPLHAKLEEVGQIEITTTPYYHPILPLLCDFRSAFEALPWLQGKLGFEPVSLKDDAVAHVESAIALHERVFGRRPRGMWPAEGSVSMDVVPILAQRGIRYVATDEEILAHSIDKPIRRDGHGNVLDGDLLYRPWHVRVGDAEVAVLFRDHRLSDLFGFHYQRDPGGAVDDFMRRLLWIRDHGPEGAVVSVILDGENAWEHYPEGGVPFLRSLYRRLSEEPWVETVRMGDAVASDHEVSHLPRLHAGSWIDHSFYIWIGHDEDRQAWRALLDARRELVAAESAGRVKGQDAVQAWQEIRIAEGSDWYWWYGDDKTSGMDDIFDSIFRAHLKNVYRLCGSPTPLCLEEPIKRSLGEPPYEKPRGFLRIRLDGRRTSFFEWLGAGRFRSEQEAGSMGRAQAGSILEVVFGFDAEQFFLALDFGDRRNRIFVDGSAVHVIFLTPQQRELVIEEPGRMRLGSAALSTVALDEILELAVPWGALGVSPGEELRFFVEIRREGSTVERTPRGFSLRVRVPGSDFESREWSA